MVDVDASDAASVDSEYPATPSCWSCAGSEFRYDHTYENFSDLDCGRSVIWLPYSAATTWPTNFPIQFEEWSPCTRSLNGSGTTDTTVEEESHSLWKCGSHMQWVEDNEVYQLLLAPSGLASCLVDAQLAGSLLRCTRMAANGDYKLCTAIQRGMQDIDDVTLLRVLCQAPAVMMLQDMILVLKGAATPLVMKITNHIQNFEHSNTALVKTLFSSFLVMLETIEASVSLSAKSTHFKWKEILQTWHPMTLRMWHRGNETRALAIATSQLLQNAYKVLGDFASVELGMTTAWILEIRDELSRQGSPNFSHYAVLQAIRSLLDRDRTRTATYERRHILVSEAQQHINMIYMESGHDLAEQLRFL